jgi:hypothetical protein
MKASNFKSPAEKKHTNNDKVGHKITKNEKKRQIKVKVG